MLIVAIIFAVFAAATLISFYLLNTYLPVILNKIAESQNRRAQRLSVGLEESFIFIEDKRHRLMLIFSPLVVALAGFLISKHIIGIIVGFAFGLFLPGMLIKFARARHIKKFRGQMVDSLMILSSSVKAGLSFIQAIEVLCSEMPPPASLEFGMVLKENKWGVSLDESLKRMRKRLPLEEVNLLVTALLIARESGGDLPKVLSRLTDTIRNNIKLKAKIAILTMQGKLQGVVMSILPFVFVYFVYSNNPEHFEIFLNTEKGRLLMLVAVALQVAGMILIRRISSSKF